MVARHKRDEKEREAEEKFRRALQIVHAHPLLGPLAEPLHFVRQGACPEQGWAVARQSGVVELHPKRRGEVEEWTWVLAHCVLHYGFDHFQRRPHPVAWNAACDLVVARFLRGLGVGKAPGAPTLPDEPSARDEERIYQQLVRDGVPPALLALSTAPGAPDLVCDHPALSGWPVKQPIPWTELFAAGLRAAVSVAVDVAGGARRSLLDPAPKRSVAEEARAWFLSSYPLMGALARTFELVEDQAQCTRLDIAVAAVDEWAQVIYVSPRAHLRLEEAKFVLAHEFLHVGLRHLERRRGRDPFLWNVACDFVINAWLLEMQVGTPPSYGLLYDPEVALLSAEEIYDRLAKDLRRARKLATLRGGGLGDLLDESVMRRPGEWTDLDAFYRSCLARGLDLHAQQGRGLLPGGLLEEIRALQQPPVPWDVQLAQWFDAWFPALESHRSYARPSRRQASTPDIPRPRFVIPEDLRRARTFGVVLDTSGSMDARLLGKGLGAIAAYAESHDVPAVRVIYCDAAAYDAGYLPPAAIAERAQVRGRGGTVLQPGIELLQRSETFPSDGPILIITDGACDTLQVRRAHAFLLPAGKRLPFRPIGPVFELE